MQREDVAIPVFAMYSRCCTFHTGRADVRPAIPTVLDLLATGRLDPSIVTTRTAAWDDSIDAPLDTPMKLVVTH
ncbi:hypothetical protein [Nocardia sp. NPDC046763]|uniref:hypothetical protein n=1 Tax=Nocardia sp. NPDC046763 TaxID=3155256 RepID=UPI0033F79A75